MWIDIIKLNFKEILNTLSSKPWVIFIMGLMFTTGYFINKWTDAREDLNIELQRVQREKDSINGVAYDRLLKQYELELQRRQQAEKMDSIIRVKIEKPLNELKDNVEP